MQSEQKSFMPGINLIPAKDKQKKNTPQADMEKFNQLLLSLKSMSVLYRGKSDEISQRAYMSNGSCYVFLNIHCCRTKIENIEVTERFDF